MGMADRIGDIADAKSDSVGLQFEEERLPQRIRTSGSVIAVKTEKKFNGCLTKRRATFWFDPKQPLAPCYRTQLGEPASPCS